MTLEQAIAAQLGGTAQSVAYAGGVEGRRVTLPYESYLKAASWLETYFGAPAEREKWHPSHMRKPLYFRFDDVDGEHHINLLLVGRTLKKRRTWLTFWPETGQLEIEPPSHVGLQHP